jgi:two-component system nitrogen regulation response regulator NtrX
MNERILIIDDEASIRTTLAEILEDEGYRVTTTGTATEGRRLVEEPEAYDLVLTDLSLPDGDGLELLAEWSEKDLGLSVIVISGHGNVDTAVKATRLGAFDFLEKPLALPRVLLTVQNALEKVRLSRQVAMLSRPAGSTEKVLVGNSAPMKKLLAEMERAAASDSRLLITGENGTGKELVARQVHQLSQRSGAAFVEVNCAAIPEELIESELFGHMKGAFTGATADRAGRFEQADHGTLFLDEIADMSWKTQAKVLRVLQEQRFERVGSAAPIQVNVRVLAATNKDLQEEIRANNFREDLYFRLAVIPLEVPPLRERTEDVPELVDHFVDRFAQELGCRPKAVNPLVIERLLAYSWPGNVRELRNFIERMMIMVLGEEITTADLPGNMLSEVTASLRTLLVDEQFSSLRAAREAFEKRYIERKLKQHAGNVAQTARALDLERSHLHRKIKAYGIVVLRG